MKTWREAKVGKKIKRPKSPRMIGLKNETKSVLEKLKKQKQNEKLILQQIQKCTKNLGQQFISIRGLETLSAQSIKKIQDNRQKTTIRLIHLVSNLSVINRNIKKLEKKYGKII